MDAIWLLTQSPTDPGGDWGIIVPLVAVLSTAATVVATAILNRRKGKSDFTGEVLKEMEFWKAKAHDGDKAIAARDSEISALNEQSRLLGRENASLLRKEHEDVLGRLEALWKNLNETRIGERGTAIQLNEIHDLVNSRLTEALEKIEQLEAAVTAYQVDKEKRRQQ